MLILLHRTHLGEEQVQTFLNGFPALILLSVRHRHSVEHVPGLRRRFEGRRLDEHWSGSPARSRESDHRRLPPPEKDRRRKERRRHATKRTPPPRRQKNSAACAAGRRSTESHHSRRKSDQRGTGIKRITLTPRFCAGT